MAEKNSDRDDAMRKITDDFRESMKKLGLGVTISVGDREVVICEPPESDPDNG